MFHRPWKWCDFFPQDSAQGLWVSQVSSPPLVLHSLPNLPVAVLLDGRHAIYLPRALAQGSILSHRLLYPTLWHSVHDRDKCPFHG